MPKKSKRVNKSRRRRTRKQRTIMMIGCSKKNALRNKSCPNCGPNCRCGPHCRCPKPCPGNCLNTKGGGLIPQDLLNLGRDFGYNFKTAYNTINGYNPPVNPAPYKGQLSPRGF